MAGKIRNPLMRLVPVKYRMAVRKLFKLKKNKGNNRYCVICESNLKEFLTVKFDNLLDHSPFMDRENAQCPVCGSLERYRLIFIYLKNKTNIFEPPLKKILHTAPELLLTEKFKSNKYVDYVSSDIDPRKTGAMLKIDLTNINIADNTFDVIISSHVLEHIMDDKKALSEIFRILKPGGWAVILVPIISEKTFISSDIKDEKDRIRLYGKEDHVRGYGLDFKELLQNTGFKVEVINYTKELSDSEIQYMGLLKEDIIFHCRK
jgi:SAM-dependent methyltransferase